MITNIFPNKLIFCLNLNLRSLRLKSDALHWWGDRGEVLCPELFTITGFISHGAESLAASPLVLVSGSVSDNNFL